MESNRSIQNIYIETENITELFILAWSTCSVAQARRNVLCRFKKTITSFSSCSTSYCIMRHPLHGTQRKDYLPSILSVLALLPVLDAPCRLPLGLTCQFSLIFRGFSPCQRWLNYLNFFTNLRNTRPVLRYCLGSRAFLCIIGVDSAKFCERSTFAHLKMYHIYHASSH